MIQLSNLMRVIFFLLTAGLAIAAPPAVDGPAVDPSAQAPATASRDEIPAEALRADLDHWLTTVEAVHPDPYRYTSREAFRGRVEALRDRLDEPMTRRAFYVEMAQLAASLQDGHTRVDWPRRDFVRDVRRGARVMPFNVEHRPQSVRIREACPEAEALGGAVLSAVGDLPATALHDTLQTLVGGTAQYREASVDRGAPLLAWAMGFDGPFRVVTRRAGSGEHTDTLRGVGLSGVQSCLAPDQGGPVTFDRVDAGGGRTAGVLTVNALKQPSRIELGVAAALQDVEARPVDGLIIDLRGNAGGTLASGVHVLAPLTRDPVRFTRSKAWKVSDAYKEHLRRQGNDDHPYLKARTGKTMDVGYDPERLSWSGPRYDGRVVVLIGPRTFSAAVKLADALQHYAGATLVGEETGGRPTGFGEGYPFRLPNSGLSAMASTAFFVRLNGHDPDDGGLHPDVRVPASPVIGTDLTLQTALQIAVR